MRSTVIALLAFGAAAPAQLQVPLSSSSPYNPFSHSPPSQDRPGRDYPRFGAPELGATFAKFAASKVDPLEAAAFSPVVRSFDTLREDVYSTLAHPAYPRHSVRIKKSHICDGCVDAYTGYIDVEARHLFFYFFKSRGNWTEDDVIFWTNGGPGCSSATGLFVELGPYRFTNSSSGPTPWEYGWDQHANVIFVDQPIGVGFSYADHGEHISSTEEAAIDAAALAFVFFEHFQEFKGKPFHMAGESYAGRYLPLFASAIYDLNPRLVKAGFDPVNLTSVMIGNGMTDYGKMIPSYFEMQCTPASIPPILDISTCVRMKTAVPRCEKAYTASCVDTYDAMNCGAAAEFCYTEISAPFLDTGLNPYDMTKACETETECYAVQNYIADWLALPSTHAALGVDDAVSGFTHCSIAVNRAFLENGDMYHSTGLWVAGLLERGVRTLIYVGENDLLCNWVGNSRWLAALDWSGHDAYTKAEERVWKYDGQGVGRTRSAGPLTYATLRGAGHFVPYDKPQESLEMVRRWIKGEEL